MNLVGKMEVDREVGGIGVGVTVTEMTRRENALVRVLELGYVGYRRSHRVPWYVDQAVRMILWCRTPALGGHIESCPSGDFHRVVYNSCGHRFCPRCAYRRQQEWLAHQQTRLLSVEHYHVIFTLPHELNALWLASPGNGRLMGSHLFAAALGALQTLLADPDRLGVTAGITATLQTWSQTLQLHPHLHCLVTGGGLTSEGAWKSAGGFLVHVKPLMVLFRGKYLALVRDSLESGELSLPGGMSRKSWERLLQRLGRVDWSVFIPRQLAPRECVLSYQGRYIYGGPIAASRILEVSESWVTFVHGGRYDVEEQHRAQETLCLPLEEFVSRLLLHVPSPGFQRVRHYGLYASCQRKRLEHCRQLLAALGYCVSEQCLDSEEPEGCLEAAADLTRCPVCGKRLYVSRLLPSSRTGRLASRHPSRHRVGWELGGSRAVGGG